MATDENNHKNEARDDWTGCTFRVERGPSSEGRAWGMADILTDVRRRVWPARPGILPRRPARDQARPRRRLTPPAQAFAGHSSFGVQVQSKVRAAFAAGASGKKKLNKREQKDVRGPRPIICFASIIQIASVDRLTRAARDGSRDGCGALTRRD